jgi:hypothetical protein
MEDNADFLRGLGMLLPATPFEIPVNQSLPYRRFAKWGLGAGMQADNGEEITPFDVGRTAQETVEYAIGPVQGIRYVQDMFDGVEKAGSDFGSFAEQVLGTGQDEYQQYEMPMDQAPVRFAVP